MNLIDPTPIQFGISSSYDQLNIQPILPGLESFGKLSQLSDELSGADLLEHLMREEQSNNADYIIDEIEASLLRDENSAFRIGGNSLRMSEVANGSSCSIEQLEKKNSMAKLVCPNKNGKNANEFLSFPTKTKPKPVGREFPAETK